MNKAEYTVLLAGNPNVGKSTIFNALTGMKQHTGNWSGKTVENSFGYFDLEGSRVTLCDLPGTYSLSPCSAEEEAAVESICYDSADAIIVVGDATAPLRGITFALQVSQVRKKVLLCLNLADEAARQRISIDCDRLSKALGMPVVLTAARKQEGFASLYTALLAVCEGEREEEKPPMSYREADSYLARCEAVLAPYCRTISPRWASVILLEDDLDRVSRLAERLELPSEVLLTLDEIVQAWQCFCEESLGQTPSEYFSECLQVYASEIFDASVYNSGQISLRTRLIDKVVLGKWTAIPCLTLLVAGLLWLSIVGANYPSSLLSALFAWMERVLRPLTDFLPLWAEGILWDGGWRVLTWVVAVMLPPMAIFFPLFTLLEDFGLLPRMAFLTDAPFAAVGCSGKQALTMCMSLGCTCTGVMGTRIIECPHQRRIALLTASLIPCNGRFPLLLALISLFAASTAASGLIQFTVVLGMLVFSVVITLLASKFLHFALYRHEKSRFVMELPSYRPPQIGKVLLRSLFDRTLRILGRAASAAAPAGMLLWLLCHLTLGGSSLLGWMTELLDPIGRFFGLDGAILTAFLLGLPASEIVLPVLLLCYSGAGLLTPVEGLTGVYDALVGQGWTALTALCTGIFCICHFPCLTTLRTIRKESGSSTAALFAAIFPTLIGLFICLLVRMLSVFF